MYIVQVDGETWAHIHYDRVSLGGRVVSVVTRRAIDLKIRGSGPAHGSSRMRDDLGIVLSFIVSSPTHSCGQSPKPE